MRKLNLNKLKKGQPGITKEVGVFLAQGALYCFTENNHKSGIQLKIDGIVEEDFQVTWTDKSTEQLQKSWEQLEATEYGATGIAVLLLEEVLDYVILERSYLGTGCDYFIAPKNEDFNKFPEKKDRLEISGLWKESLGNTIKGRVKDKKKQTNKSDSPDSLVFIIVTEFKTPKSKFIKK